MQHEERVDRIAEVKEFLIEYCSKKELTQILNDPWTPLERMINSTMVNFECQRRTSREYVISAQAILATISEIKECEKQ
jgi:hypothetical protein